MLTRQQQSIIDACEARSKRVQDPTAAEKARQELARRKVRKDLERADQNKALFRREGLSHGR